VSAACSDRGYISYRKGLGCLDFIKVNLDPSNIQRVTYGIIRCWYSPSGLISLPFASFLDLISRPQRNNADKINMDSSAKSVAGQRLYNRGSARSSKLRH